VMGLFFALNIEKHFAPSIHYILQGKRLTIPLTFL